MRKVERVVKAFLHAGILGEDGLMRNTTCTAIRNVHRQHGLANPAEDETVRLGLRRTFGTAPGASNGRYPPPRRPRPVVVVLRRNSGEIIEVARPRWRAIW